MVKDCDKTTLEITACVYAILVCKLVPPLPKNLLVAISQPVMQITQQIRCLDPGFEGQRL